MAKTKKVRTAVVKDAITPKFNTNEFESWYEDFKEALRAKGVRNGDIMSLDPKDQQKNFKAGLKPDQAVEG